MVEDLSRRGQRRSPSGAGSSRLVSATNEWCRRPLQALPQGARAPEAQASGGAMAIARILKAHVYVWKTTSKSSTIASRTGPCVSTA
jgi:hypothetical protein